MLVLGIHGGYRQETEDMEPDAWSMHDGAAVLLKDGEVVAAIEEERLNRVKHSNFFPNRAIRACLDYAGVTADQLDHIVVNCTEDSMNYTAMMASLREYSKPFRSGRARVAELVSNALGCPVGDRIRFCEHHLAHAWSAFIPSGFDRSLILSIDGEGDGLSGMALVGHDGTFETIQKYPGQGHSLGQFYTGMIRFLGYTRFEEYKVMGLAPYGDPERFSDLFSKFYELLPDGDYKLHHWGMILKEVQKAGLHPLRKGEALSQAYKDFAASLQVHLERIVFHMLRHFQAVTGERRLCLAGGVIHNCVLNGKILYSGLFDEVFAQPVAHDAGGAWGAALSVYYQESRNPVKPKRMSHLYWGLPFGDDDDTEECLQSWGALIDFERQPDIAARAAELMAEGAVIGWVQGRSEFGPRSLGNRSILADPRPLENKTRINAMVKKREGYRPFAPSVAEECAGDYFELDERCSSYPFMIMVLKVREAQRELLGAITHVDGTARVHTVSKETNPRYWSLLNAFGKLTGVPMVLNTSFNNNAEPIVDSVDDAVTCFLTTDIDYLVVGDYLVRRKPGGLPSLVTEDLVLSLRPSRKLVRRASAAGEGCVNQLESTMSRYFGGKPIEISDTAFEVLLRQDGEKTLSQLCREARIEISESAALMQELIEFWEKRAVVLLPVRVPKSVSNTNHNQEYGLSEISRV